jgi:hypothetical protein
MISIMSNMSESKRILTILTNSQGNAMRSVWTMMMAGIFGLPLCLTAAAGDPQSLHYDFRKGTPGQPLQLVGNTPAKYIRVDSHGLYIALPGEEKKALPQTGLNFPSILEGDFEITLTYEIAKIQTPTTGYGCGVALFVQSESPKKEAATLASLKSIKGEMRFAANRHTNGEDGKRVHLKQNIPVTGGSLKGRLRLSRLGNNIRFAASGDGEQEMQELRVAEFGSEPVTTIRAVADPGGSTSPLEVILLELVIKSDKLTTEATRFEQAGTSNSWKIGLTVVIAGSFIGGFVWWRRHRSAVQNRSS